ncbi:MAG: RNA polymerase factor sigma-54 [Bdellovibrionales bacterium]|nr:RNA polymerase factor sigma-54 [Bdellovibrionales bacterium]
MAFDLKQSLRLSQQLVMTPQLQQAIKLLQLNRQELSELVTQELVENPVLEETADGPEDGGEAEPQQTADGESAPEAHQDPEGEQRRDEEAFNQPQTQEEKLVSGKDDFNWDSYIEDFNATSSTAPSMREVNDELPSFENVLTKTNSLEDHIEWQLSMAGLTDQERMLAELIIGNLSEDGYFTASLPDLAAETKMELEDAEEVLKIIHHFDPLGVGSRDLRECLLIQARLMNPRQPLLERILEDHLPNLERRNYAAVAKALDAPMEKVQEAVRLIMELEPKPGRAFQGSGDNQYISPDIYVYKVGDEYQIVLNEDGLPKLRISPYYRNILQSARSGTATAGSKETREYVQEKLRSAMWLIRSIHNRQKTIYRVTEAIVNRQRDFFEKGVQQLKPMILKDVANDIGMHESTISRVTTNKYVHTPVGIFELKYFFNSSIGSTDGSSALASEAVKDKIRQLVAKEDPKNPLSDQKIVELLKNDHIDIARRTVAKYRDMLNILPSSRRKQIL